MPPLLLLLARSALRHAAAAPLLLMVLLLLNASCGAALDEKLLLLLQMLLLLLPLLKAEALHGRCALEEARDGTCGGAQQTGPLAALLQVAPEPSGVCNFEKAMRVLRRPNGCY